MSKRRRSEEDFAEEIRAHLQLEADALEAEGMEKAQAERSARLAFGNATIVRERWNLRDRWVWMRDLVDDLRFGARTMLRNRGVTAIAILTLAVGIGASSTAFTWIDKVQLQPLGGVTEPDRLVNFESVTPNGEWVTTSYPDYMDFRDHLDVFDGMAVTLMSAFSVGNAEHSERVWGELVSGNYFSVLGVKPEQGRLFLPAEFGDAIGKFPIAVISDRYWRSHFNADPSIVGRTIRVNQHELTVVGVAPPAFHGSIPLTAFDLWIPYMQQPVLNGVQEWMLRDRHTRNLLGIARVKHGVTLEQARLALKTLAERMAVLNANVSQGMSATIMPLWQSPHGPQGLLAGPLHILMGVCVLVLLIVCANVANLQVARAMAREKEFTARLALGAPASRLARQVLTESLLLTGTGAMLGLAATPWLSHSLKFLMPPGPMQMLVAVDSRPNLPVLAFTASLCVISALVAGILPALHVARLDLTTRLNGGGRSGSAGQRRQIMRSALVISEVALALVAIVGAGLFARGFERTMHLDPKFDPDHVLVSQLYLSSNGYSLVQRKEFCRRLEEHMQSAPGVNRVAFSDGIPLGFQPSWWEELKIEGYTPQPDENMSIFRNVVSPGYLPLMHIPIVDGRNFTDQDNEKAPAVMIVNQAFVKRFFPGGNPIGKMVHGWGLWFRIVGVARDSKYHYLGELTPPYFYVPFQQVYREDMNLAFYVRTPGEPQSILSTLRRQVQALDPNITVFDAVPLNEFIGASLYPQKVAATVMTVMGAVALLLAAVGLYSVIAYSVAQRTREIGVRMALGARPSHVLVMVVRQGLSLTIAGLFAGAVVSIALARAVESVSFTNSAMGSNIRLLDGNAFDPLIYAGAAVFLCVVGMLSASVPARRAASIDPMSALRIE
ncbi:ABC transporter permease [Acidobacteria bacterium AB60]|nr:ABC transporter permease [Acidobacteria bacterium AB60]